MQASYTAVSRDFNDKEAFIGSEYHKLQPQQWPLARLSISVQKCVDHLDRVLADCCWEVHATRADPEESLPSLGQVSKCLTKLLAIHLAKEVAAILTMLQGLRNPHEEKAYRGPDYKVVHKRWKQSQWWIWHYKDQRAPHILDISGFIRAFRGKDENARAEIDTYMSYCAKRWQTREGTYQLKRRRLLPDVRDPPEQGDEEVDMTDI